MALSIRSFVRDHHQPSSTATAAQTITISVRLSVGRVSLAIWSIFLHHDAADIIRPG
jgi:hypothetical protein